MWQLSQFRNRFFVLWQNRFTPESGREGEYEEEGAALPEGKSVDSNIYNNIY
jgi:hypothetical protein